jgi:hypothetical protein
MLTYVTVSVDEDVKTARMKEVIIVSNRISVDREIIFGTIDIK